MANQEGTWMGRNAYFTRNLNVSSFDARFVHSRAVFGRPRLPDVASQTRPPLDMFRENGHQNNT